MTATLDGNPLPAGWSVTANGNALSVNLPSTFTSSTAGDTINLSFDATVLDQSANQRTDSITNTATLNWNDSVGTAQNLTAQASTTVVEPDLSVTKTDDTKGAPVKPGQTVTFTVTASNASATDVSPAHDVKVVDTVPSGLTVLNTSENPAADGDTVSSDGNGGVYSQSARTITWSDIGTLAPGASSALTYKATVNANPVGGSTLTNSVTDTTSSLPAGTSGERTAASSTNTGYTATATDTLTAAGPSILKTVTPTSATIGQQASYTATVTLPANTVFHDLTILDTLPDGLAFDSYGTTSCSFFPCNVTSLGTASGSATGTTDLGWYVGEEGPFSTDQTIVIHYTAHVESTYAAGGSVTDGKVLTNSATVETDTTQQLSGAPSSPPAASSFTNQYGPATAPLDVIEPAIGITKDVADGNATPSQSTTAKVGDTLTYSVKVTNTGDAPAYAVKVNDTPPTTLTDVTPVQGAGDVTQGWSASSPQIDWTIPGPIAAGASVTLTYTAQIRSEVADATIDNTASVPSYTGLPSGQSNGRTYNNDPQSSASVTVPDTPQLSLSKSVDPMAITAAGQSVKYSFLVTNTGNVTLAPVTIDDSDFSGTGTTPSVNCPTGASSLAPGAQVTCTASYTATQADVDAGVINNTATASGTPPNGPAVSSGKSSATVNVTPNPSLTLDKSVDVTSGATIGQVLHYSFLVTNTGNVTLAPVVINEGTFSGSGGTPTVSCPSAANSLAPKATVTCTASYTVTQKDVDAGKVTNSATASGTPPTGQPVTSAPSSATTTSTSTPDLTIVKTVSPNTVDAAGQQVTFSYKITNVGNLTLAPVVVNEGAFSGTGGTPTVTCPAAASSLAPGASVTCTAPYTVTQADVDAGKITNTATASGTTILGAPVQSAPSTATVTAQSNPSVSLVKSVDATSGVTAGQTLNYSFLITNTGNVTLAPVSVNETAFNGAGSVSSVSCPSAANSLAPGAQVTCTATYTVEQADIDAQTTLTNTAVADGTPPTGAPVGSSPSTVTSTPVAPDPEVRCRRPRRSPRRLTRTR